MTATIESMVYCVRPEEMAEMLANYPKITGVPTCWSDGGKLFPKPRADVLMRCSVQRRFHIPTGPMSGLYFRVSHEPYPIENPLGEHDAIVTVTATRKIPEAVPADIMASIHEFARAG